MAPWIPWPGARPRWCLPSAAILLAALSKVFASRLEQTTNAERVCVLTASEQPERFVYFEARPGGASGPPWDCVYGGGGVAWQVFLGRLPLPGLLDARALPPRALPSTPRPGPQPPPQRTPPALQPRDLQGGCGQRTGQPATSRSLCQPEFSCTRPSGA